jgi:hypothetical protein
MQELREPVSGKAVQSELPPVPRWVTALFTLAAVALLPWTLYLTLTLPSRHVTTHYDVAWVGFDVALAAAFSGTAWAAVRASAWLPSLAAVTGTMLVCDAWFDVVTSFGANEVAEAVAEAIFVELPLAAICAFIVYDAETFLRATVHRYSSMLGRVRRRDGLD